MNKNLRAASVKSAAPDTTRSTIIATGSALPSIELENKDIEKFLDTNDQWITERVGIKKRYICDSHESSVSLARDASLKAFKDCGMDPEEIDLIIFATVTPDKPLPSAAALLIKELGIKDCLAFDIKAACSGFIYALATADSLLQSLGLKNALIIGAESLSRITDWRDRNTAVLFGDGAGACILSRETESTESCIISSYLRTAGEGAHLIQQSGTHHFPPNQEPATKSKSQSCTDSSYIQMSGREVFKSGIELMTKSIQEVLKSSQKSISDISLFIPHQSNERMIKAVCDNVGLKSQDKIALNIMNVGNTSAASIPIALDEYNSNGSIKPGDVVLLTAVGSGMTYGSVLIEW